MEKKTIQRKRKFEVNFINKLKLVLITVVIFSDVVNSQDLPKVIPPSPEAAALFRFLDYPVNHSTGVPQISFPLYEIKSGSLSLPISISYHAAGRRITDQAQPIGVGWTLNAGGMVSRTIYGKPDEWTQFPSVLQPTFNLNNRDNYDYLASLYYSSSQDVPNNGPVYDSEFDIYSYSFGSYSGKFVLSGDRETVHMLPQKPIKITPPNAGHNGLPPVIVDDKGVTYEFGQFETYQEGALFSVATSALLTRIVSADKKDEITFIYEPFTKLTDNISDQYLLIDDNSTNDQSTSYYQHSVNNNQRLYTVWRLKEIVFREGKVKFNLNGDGTADRISSIDIIRNDNSIIKTISFQLSTLNLDKLIFKDQNAQAVETYSFEYNLLPPSPGWDYWGYFNSTGNISSGVPTYNVQYYPSSGNVGTMNVGGGASRSSNSVYAQGGVLKKITYPTGGTTELSYEGNRVKHANISYEVGGLRIKEIKTKDNNGHTQIKTYAYGINESGYGFKTLFPVYMDYMSYETRYFPAISKVFNPDLFSDPNSFMYPSASLRRRIYSSEILLELSEVHNEPVFYSEVTEYNGTPTNNNGKTVYKYDGGSNYNVGSYTTPLYGGLVNINDCPYGSGMYGGPANDTYTNYVVDPNMSRFHINEYNLWLSNELAETAFYEKTSDPSNPYRIRRKINNYYTNTVTNTLKGMRIFKYLDIVGDLGTGNSNEGVAAKCMGLPVFIFSDYSMVIGKRELTETVATEFTDQGQIVNTTDYEYNSNTLVSKITRGDSKGETKITTYAYPTDFASTQPYAKMVENNIIAPVIEESTYKNAVLTGNHLQSNKTDYTFWSNGQPTTTPNNSIYPKTVLSKTGANNYLERLNFRSYSEDGNITSVSKANDVVKSYIWGYNNSYPVAEFVGVSYDNAMALLDQGIIQNPSSDANLRTELNKIRTTYPSAQVTTYTYKPLVGMTSQTDENGRTTYYVYDAAGRLQLIKDKDSNMVKTFEYKYKQ